MSDSWYELASLGLTVRPLSDLRPEVNGRYSDFSAPMSSTISLLARELDMLRAEKIVLELALRDSQIRADGLPRASARADSPAVVLSFDSKHGPVRMATGEFSTWQDNLRGIAKSLEALRMVDRYGVSKRGEQYRGWKALPASSDPADNVVTEDQAWRVIVNAAEIPVDSSPLLNGISQSDAIRRALKNTHPDHGGDEAAFRAVIRAREILTP